MVSLSVGHYTDKCLPNFDNGEEVIVDIGDFSNKYFYESVTKKLYDLWKNYLMLNKVKGDNDEEDL